MKQGMITATAILPGGLRIKRPMNRFIILLASVMAGIMFSGCAAKYGCPVPGGVQCRSISEVYAGTKTGHPPDAALEKKEKGNGSPPKPAASVLEPPGGVPLDWAVPVRSAPKVLRVLVTPWIDHDGDLHQKGYLYIVIDPGRWAVGLPAVEPGPAPALKKTPEARPGSAPESYRPESQNNGK